MSDSKIFYSVGRSSADPVRTVEIKIKRSRFICSLAYADTMTSAKNFITTVAKANPRANHNCWAYVVGDKGQFLHCSDAGEPAGTAGKPMLNTLQGHDMTCVAAVVTRYFGGVKLGVRGLIDAYGQSVTAAIESAPLVKLVHTRHLMVDLSYAMNDTFLNRLQAYEVEVVHTDYGAGITHELAVDVNDFENLEAFLEELQHQGALEYILEK